MMNCVYLAAVQGLALVMGVGAMLYVYAKWFFRRDEPIT